MQNDPPQEQQAGKVGRRMEKAKEITTEVKEEVKEAAAEVAAKLAPVMQSVGLRETICGEGFDDKRGWRRIAALLGATNSPFCR